jgi:hypothetical protein
MIKYLQFLPLSILLFSCGEKTIKEIQISTELSYTFDTVMVDAGDEFLHLNDNLFISDLSADGRYLFNWNRNTNTLEKIDLNELVLAKKINFEQEGPNGVGPFAFFLGPNFTTIYQNVL